MFDMQMIPEMGMRVTPALLNLAQLLTLPSMDLHQLVRQELSENPALEEIEYSNEPCVRCGSPLIEGFCFHCASADPFAQRLTSEEPDAIDPLTFVRAPASLFETLLVDLQASLSASEYPIAIQLVGSLDEYGFLSEAPEMIAERIGVAPERVHAVLTLLRELGPLGIATQNTRECLLVQIDALEAKGVTCSHVRTIVDEYLEELASGHLKGLARMLGTDIAAIEAARAFIRRYLWPYPAQAATGDAAPLQRTRYRTPDMAILRRDETFLVEVLHSPRRVLRLSPLYQQLAQRTSHLDEQERAHVQEYIGRARVFLANLRQRESTLQRIGEAIVERQEAFLLHGVRHQAPMTRAEIAVEISLHESTVSRAIADKTALLPNQSLLPMSDFFVAARGIHDILREIIANEPHPMSDTELATQLAQHGHPIARRTVAKYRDQLRIPAAHLR
jgi:RNA polymerase sigma-54 factor